MPGQAPLVVELNVQVATVLKATAASGRVVARCIVSLYVGVSAARKHVLVVSNVGVSGLGTSLAILEVVLARGTAAVAVVALEDALVHVGVAAARGLNLHAVAAHVGLAGDVDGGVGAGGELAPGVEDLAVLEDGDAVVQRGKGAGNVLRKRDGDGVTGVGQRPGDVRLADVDEARDVVGLEPDDDDDGGGAALGRAVPVRRRRLAVVADPDGAVVVVLVLAHGAEANVGHVLAILARETPDGVVTVEAALLNDRDGVFAALC